MDEKDDVINENFLYMYEKKYRDEAIATGTKIVIILSQLSINYHYFVEQDVVVTVDILTTQRKAFLENVRKNNKNSTAGT